MKTRIALPINFAIFRSFSRRMLFGMVFAVGFSTSAFAAPVQVVSGGNLVGINGVDVGQYGKFDVAFTALWDGTLQTQAFATAAASALFTLYDIGGQFDGTVFDTAPELTAGCTDLAECIMQTPFADPSNGLMAASYYNWIVFQHTIFNPIFINTANSTFAAWTASPALSPVPIPAALFMFAPALLGFLGFRRKMQA